MRPIGSEHGTCVNRLTALLNKIIGGQTIVSIQNPIRLSENTEPQSVLLNIPLQIIAHGILHRNPNPICGGADGV